MRLAGRSSRECYGRGHRLCAPARRPASGRGARLPRRRSRLAPRASRRSRRARPARRRRARRTGSPRCTATRPRRGPRRRAASMCSSRTGTASGKTLAFNLPVAGRARPRAEAARALPLSDQGARAGPGARARGLRRPEAARRDLRRRHALRAALADPQVGQRDPDQPGHAPRRRPARTTTAGATCSRTSATSSSTRRTSTAASSAPTSPTCCGGCGGWPGSTAPSRSSCSPRRRSPTRASSRTRCSACEATVIGDDGAPRAERTIALWNPPLARRGARAARERARRGVAAAGGARRPRAADDLLREEPQGGRAHPPLRRASGSAPSSRGGSLPTAPATRPSSAARSSGGSSRASCSA